MKIIEFYSGIGGARLGVEKWAAQSGKKPQDVQIVAAYDMNETANKVYLKNFGEKVRAQSIEHIKIEEIEKLSADGWLMSPPCQPFTPNGGRNGGKADTDRRTDSFVKLTTLFKKMDPSTRPSWLIVENVKGFQESDTLKNLKLALDTLDYTTKELVTTPKNFGVPYNRSRYYLLASKKQIQDEPLPAESQPTLAGYLLERGCKVTSFTDRLKIPEELFSRHSGYRFAVVTPGCRETPCFTKGYGKNHRGAGGILCINETPTKKSKIEDPTPQHIPGEDLLPSEGRIYRYFSPEEVLALHGFPTTFAFPETYTNIMKWKLIGNSLSCDVHAELCKMLFS